MVIRVQFLASDSPHATIIFVQHPGMIVIYLSGIWEIQAKLYCQWEGRIKRIKKYILNWLRCIFSIISQATEKLFILFFSNGKLYIITGNSEGSIGLYNISEINSHDKATRKDVKSDSTNSEIVVDIAEKYYNLSKESVPCVSFDPLHKLLSAVTGDRDALKNTDKYNNFRQQQNNYFDRIEGSSEESSEGDCGGNFNKTFVFGLDIWLKPSFGTAIFFIYNLSVLF